MKKGSPDVHCLHRERTGIATCRLANTTCRLTEATGRNTDGNRLQFAHRDGLIPTGGEPRRKKVLHL